MDTRFFVPEAWLTDAYAARRTKGQGPEGLTFHTKPPLAVEMVRDIDQADTLSFKDMVADCLYGNSPEWIEAAEHCGGKISVVSMPAATRCW